MLSSKYSLAEIVGNIINSTQAKCIPLPMFNIKHGDIENMDLKNYPEVVARREQYGLHVGLHLMFYKQNIECREH